MATSYRARKGKIVAGILSDLSKNTRKRGLSLTKNTLKSPIDNNRL